MIRRAAGPVPARIATVPTIAVVLALGGCATTYDSSATTAPPATATTVFTPAGTPEELLAALAADVGGLSERLVEGEGQGEALARIDARWAAVRPTIESEHPELLEGFDAALTQVRRAVERRRPADADKAARSLDVLLAAVAE